MGACSSKPKTNEYDGSMAPESKPDDNAKKNMNDDSKGSGDGRKSADTGRTSMDKNNLASKEYDPSVQTCFVKPEQGEEALLDNNTLKDILLDSGKPQKQQDDVDHEKVFNTPANDSEVFEKQRPENGSALAESRESYNTYSEPLTIVDKEAEVTTSSETVKYQLRELQTDSFESDLVKASAIVYSKTVSLDREPQASDGTAKEKLQEPSRSTSNLPAGDVLVHREPAVEAVIDHRGLDETAEDELQSLQTKSSCIEAGQGNRELKPMPEEPGPVVEENGSDSGRFVVKAVEGEAQEEVTAVEGFSSVSKEALCSDVADKPQETEAHDDCDGVEKNTDTSLQLAPQNESDAYDSGREVDVKLEESQGAAIDAKRELQQQDAYSMQPAPENLESVPPELQLPTEEIAFVNEENRGSMPASLERLEPVTEARDPEEEEKVASVIHERLSTEVLKKEDAADSPVEEGPQKTLYKIEEGAETKVATETPHSVNEFVEMDGAITDAPHSIESAANGPEVQSGAEATNEADSSDIISEPQSQPEMENLVGGDATESATDFIGSSGLSDQDLQSTVLGEDILQFTVESEPSDTVKELNYVVSAADEASQIIDQDTPVVTTPITMEEEPITRLETEIVPVRAHGSESCDNEPVAESEGSLTKPDATKVPGILNRATAAGKKMSEIERGKYSDLFAAHIVETTQSEVHANEDLKERESLRSLEARGNKEIPVTGAAESVISSTSFAGKEDDPESITTQEKTLPLASPVAEPMEPGLPSTFELKALEASQNGVIADSEQSAESAMLPEVLKEGKPQVSTIEVNQNEAVKASIRDGEADAASSFAKQTGEGNLATIGTEIEESQSQLNSVGRLPMLLTDAQEVKVDQVEHLVDGEWSLDTVHKSTEEVFEPKISSEATKEMERISPESAMKEASDVKNHRPSSPEVLESLPLSKLEVDSGAQVAGYNDSTIEIPSSAATEKVMEIEKLSLAESGSVPPDAEGKLLPDHIPDKQDIDQTIPDIEQVLEKLASEFERQASAEMGNKAVPS